MKKNLAKKIVMGLLTGAVLMSSSVAWASGTGQVFDKNTENISNAGGDYALAVGSSCSATGDNSIAIGANTKSTGSTTIASGKGGIAIGADSFSGGEGSIAIGTGSDITGSRSVAIGANTKVTMFDSVALGSGSVAEVDNVVSVGREASGNDAGVYRKIVNVAKGTISEGSHDAVTGGQLYETNKNVEGIDTKIGDMGDFAHTNYLKESSNLVGAVSALDVMVKGNNDIIGSGKLGYQYANYISGKDLTEAAKELDGLVKANADAIANVYTKEQSDARYMKIAVSDDVNINVLPTITVDNAGQMIFGTNSSWIGTDGSGFFAGRTDSTGAHSADNANAAIKETGEIIGAAGKFKVDASGNVTAEKVTAKEVVAENLYTKDDIDGMLGGSNASISGINQRLDKTIAKINKVGAGAAALAALHPLEYDPDDKLTFSAGMGNYAGENAAALGAFYRPNEKFMVSLGGTMGNGENMVNLGLSIGLDKPNGYAKLSKRELIQEVNAVKAENEAIKADNEAMKAEMAEMKAMLQAILAKK